MSISSFSREATKRYLQHIVFVDDEIYSRFSGKPYEDSSNLPPFKSPYGNHIATSESKAEHSENTKASFHPKQLVDSFAKEGMICALYEPEERFDSSPGSELFTLCEKADAVILDWDLFNEDGANILPLIKNLVSEDHTNIPHHARLCIIYTSRPDLLRVIGEIITFLEKFDLPSIPPDATAPTTLVVGATRVVVLGKPESPGRTSESKALEVEEEALASRVIDEFANIYPGILSVYALHGLASVRNNAKKILDKFSQDLDGPFFLHRSLILPGNEEAFEQVPELIAEELLSILLDTQIPRAAMQSMIDERVSQFTLKPVDFLKAKVEGIPTSDLPSCFLKGDPRIIPKDKKKGLSEEDIEVLHKSLGCDETFAHKKLAALFNSRTQYCSELPPRLDFGTVLELLPKGEGQKSRYAFCMMPSCDCVRLKGEIAFPFWELRETEFDGAIGLVVFDDGKFLELFVYGKPHKQLIIDNFSADVTKGVVVADNATAPFFFTGKNEKFKWVAQLKPAHAQRIAHRIGQAFSRVGVLEAEWLRRLTS